ncbi:MAG TPA: MgtC/SapB family protein [Bauldia sp.]|nr:MgtC/SapB family protein [Bauldia sp.]
MSAAVLDSILRIVVAMLAGIALGLNRDLRGKPTGVRTLGLVAMSSALITVATLNYMRSNGGMFDNHPDALSRVVQGVLTGIGFIGAGVILRGGDKVRTRGLTTAASVWTTAIVGIVCGFGDWILVAVSVVLMLVLLIFGGAFERFVRVSIAHQTRDTPPAPP